MGDLCLVKICPLGLEKNLKIVIVKKVKERRQYRPVSGDQKSPLSFIAEIQWVY